MADIETRAAKRERPPTAVMLVGGVLSVIAVLLIGTMLIRLFNAGEVAVGAVGALIGLLTAVLPLVERGVRPVLDRLPGPAWVAVLVIQAALVLLLVFGRAPVFNALAEQRFRDAVLAESLNEAQLALESAITLGLDPDPALQGALTDALAEPAGTDNDNRAMRLAALYRVYGDATSVAAYDETLFTQARRAAGNEATDVIRRTVGVLATLDPGAAADLAREFNDTGVMALAESPPEISRARVHLGAVRTIDDLIGDARPNAEKSIARMNYAVVLENDDSVPDNLEQAVTAYREALDFNPNNYEARYNLSSLLLVAFPSSELDDAVQVAEQGREFLSGQAGNPCEGVLSAETFTQGWYCFLLTTTEAGARLERGDIRRNVEPLVDRAIALAEANNRFGEAFFTAEAYYYRALLQDEDGDPDAATLCAVLADHNPFSDRHLAWAAYAVDELGEVGCPAG